MFAFWSKFFKPHKEINCNEWSTWAKRLPKSGFIIWIAGQIANELIDKKIKTASYQMLIESIDDDSSGMLQHQAERFIENYYFGYPSFDPHKDRLIRIFRKIVKRKIAKHSSCCAKLY